MDHLEYLSFLNDAFWLPWTDSINTTLEITVERLFVRVLELFRLWGLERLIMT